MKDKNGVRRKAFHTLGMNLVTTSLNTFHVKGDTMWCMDTTSDSPRIEIWRKHTSSKHIEYTLFSSSINDRHKNQSAGGKTSTTSPSWVDQTHPRRFSTEPKTPYYRENL